MKRIRDAQKQRYNYRVWYGRNAWKAKLVAKSKRMAVQDWFRLLKATLQCVRCGESTSACLEFHHREPARKEFTLGEAIRRGMGKDRIRAEIAKCDVLCANCHRKLHWERLSDSECQWQ